jgi:hypothetical protein
MQSASMTLTTDPAGRKTPSGGPRRVGGQLIAAMGVVVLLALAGSQAVHCQMGSGSNSGQSGQSTVHPPFTRNQQDANSPFDDFDSVTAERRNRALNMERQKLMVSDANKLLKLARELNDEVASTKSDAFTSDQLHKIAEIEKLARSVRERMASAVGSPQPMMQPPSGYGYPIH